jgi:hypothetical protein
MGTSGTAGYYLNKPELSSGFEFLYPHKRYGYQSLSKIGSGSGSSGFELRSQVLCLERVVVIVVLSMELVTPDDASRSTAAAVRVTARALLRVAMGWGSHSLTLDAEVAADVKWNPLFSVKWVVTCATLTLSIEEHDHVAREPIHRTVNLRGMLGARDLTVCWTRRGRCRRSSMSPSSEISVLGK